MGDMACKDKASLPTIDLTRIEKELLKCDQDFAAPVHHHFGPGLYIRELRVQAGVVGMGHAQKQVHMNNFVSGRVLMMNDDGTHTELVAPMTFVGNPGRKVVYVLEDMVWQNIYATTETDVEILEATYLDKTDQAIDYYSDMSEKEQDYILECRRDFARAISEHNLTPEYVKEQSEVESDQMKMPYGWFKTCVRGSPISGKGFFASGYLRKGEIVAPLVINGKRTPASRYANHSHAPNSAGKVSPNGDIFLVATRDIPGCMSGNNGTEITTDYRAAMQHRSEAER